MTVPYLLSRVALFSLYSQGHPRGTWRGEHARKGGSFYSLGAMSNTVNFICHLITSMGHHSHPPARAGPSVVTVPAVGAVVWPTVSRQLPGQCADLLRPLHSPWPSSLPTHPPTQLSFKHCLLGVVKDYSTPATAGCSLGSHAPISLACPPYQAARPSPAVGGRRVCPPFTGFALTLGRTPVVCLPGACPCAAANGGCLATPGLAWSCPPPCWAPAWAER